MGSPSSLLSLPPPALSSLPAALLPSRPVLRPRLSLLHPLTCSPSMKLLEPARLLPPTSLTSEDTSSLSSELVLWPHSSSSSPLLLLTSKQIIYAQRHGYACTLDSILLDKNTCPALSCGKDVQSFSWGNTGSVHHIG